MDKDPQTAGTAVSIADNSVAADVGDATFSDEALEPDLYPRCRPMLSHALRKILTVFYAPDDDRKEMMGGLVVNFCNHDSWDPYIVHFEAMVHDEDGNIVEEPLLRDPVNDFLNHAELVAEGMKGVYARSRGYLQFDTPRHMLEFIKAFLDDHDAETLDDIIGSAIPDGEKPTRADLHEVFDFRAAQGAYQREQMSPEYALYMLPAQSFGSQKELDATLFSVIDALPGVFPVSIQALEAAVIEETGEEITRNSNYNAHFQIH